MEEKKAWKSIWVLDDGTAVELKIVAFAEREELFKHLLAEVAFSLAAIDEETTQYVLEKTGENPWNDLR